ncbi:MAG TPA: FHA domain-containing protein [Actinomycetota bacterium]|nr:FHA domain-containing protein [Actinomycetota bacterium]
MPPFVLTVLEYAFLALLYLFVYRVVRSVVSDLRTAPAAPAAPAPGPVRSRVRPTEVVVIGESGRRLGRYPLSGNLQVGRAEACQIRLDDAYVSSFHARIFSRDGSWYVEDLGSTNGTWLNHRRITGPAELRAGDRLRVGKTTLELRP